MWLGFSAGCTFVAWYKVFEMQRKEAESYRRGLTYAASPLQLNLTACSSCTGVPVHTRRHLPPGLTVHVVPFASQLEHLRSSEDPVPSDGDNVHCVGSGGGGGNHGDHSCDGYGGHLSWTREEFPGPAGLVLPCAHPQIFLWSVAHPRGLTVSASHTHLNLSIFGVPSGGATCVNSGTRPQPPPPPRPPKPPRLRRPAVELKQIGAWCPAALGTGRRARFAPPERPRPAWARHLDK